MASEQIGFLYKAASTLLQTERNPTKCILRSYYLMRCMQITKGYGLPDKHFSLKARCPHCCTEWQRDTVTKIRAPRLRKRQIKRLKSRKPTTTNPDPKSILRSNELEQICTFCKHSTVTRVLKPAKQGAPIKKAENVTAASSNNKPQQNKSKAKPTEKKTETSIYYNAKEVFSLNNKNNALASTKPNKYIKNNKRKKDKFAGLCQQAVLTTAKLKEAKDKETLLSKFLKKSS